MKVFDNIKSINKMGERIRNYLEIFGNDEQIANVCKYIAGKDEEGKALVIDFNTIEPIPEELKNTNDWEWAYKNWGSRRNAHNLFDDEENLNYYKNGNICFITVNGNALELICKLSNIFPDVGFLYHFDIDIITTCKKIIVNGEIIASKEMEG